MRPADLGHLFRTFTATAWRLEARDQYTVPEEAQLLADHAAGLPLPEQTPENDAWLARLAGARGRRFGRVHVVSRPLTPYVRFELDLYRGSVAYGEDVRIADRSLHPDGLADLDTDFWIFDDTTVAVMDYDETGRFHGARLADDLGPWLRLRDRAISVAVPFAEFVE